MGLGLGLGPWPGLGLRPLLADGLLFLLLLELFSVFWNVDKSLNILPVGLQCAKLQIVPLEHDVADVPILLALIQELGLLHFHEFAIRFLVAP